MARQLYLVLALAVLVGCGGDSPTTPDASDTSPLMKKVTPQAGVPAGDQAIVDAFNAARTTGAFVNHDECFIVGPGLRNEDGDLIGFGGLFPDPCPQGFSRLNPDGTTDNHMSGKGTFFLFLFEPFAIYGSEGSNVRWTWVSHEDGIRVLNINGVLSDGSRVRAHFNSGDNGASNAKSGHLWVEGLGYVLGAPGGK